MMITMMTMVVLNETKGRLSRKKINSCLSSGSIGFQPASKQFLVNSSVCSAPHTWQTYSCVEGVVSAVEVWNGWREDGVTLNMSTGRSTSVIFSSQNAGESLPSKSFLMTLWAMQLEQKLHGCIIRNTDILDKLRNATTITTPSEPIPIFKLDNDIIFHRKLLQTFGKHQVMSTTVAGQIIYSPSPTLRERTVETGDK
ncbi:hypothetical protein EGR_06949 [Echinococcus granulosus]|uniref:Uncharacterized protein n=1 Tax=Echinococcus granulosus TaxID=6210 RepID=W6UAU6_ECHGR|nr:hypothetical protein EGR_06949 [Echinococcus granulosus]EUB58205.1 hypothetical protein EGR_06949 [Echinococcus granulosus]